MTQTSLLVVDDQAEVCSAFRRATRKLPIHFRFATSSAEAMALVNAQVPDILVTDYLMPEGNGLDLIADVWRQWPDVDCVLYTADRISLEHLGIDVAALWKPCANEDIERLLLKVLGDRDGRPARTWRSTEFTLAKALNASHR